METQTETITIDAADLTWHVPPADQGQIVEVAYAQRPDGVLQRVTDQSVPPGGAGRVTYYWCREDDIRGDFEPWNEAPRGTFSGPVAVQFEDCGADEQPQPRRSGPPYTVRPLGAVAWAEDLPTIIDARFEASSARANGLRHVVIVDARGDIVEEC